MGREAKGSTVLNKLRKRFSSLIVLVEDRSRVFSDADFISVVDFPKEFALFSVFQT